jgi:bifunctional DNA-binding transcriptional regulator/antitoxin component of YhaV-PrlF toxin-antitoxin module
VSQEHRFRARIEASGAGGAYVTLPMNVEQVFGKKRLRVAATFDGEPYRGSAVRMGGESHILIVLKEIRRKIGKEPGDEIEVTIREDEEPRVVAVPADLQEALHANPQAAGFFEQLAYTQRREYVAWIETAKQAETRRRRIDRAVVALREGKRFS